MRDTGHFDVATPVTDSDWTPARRGPRAPLKGVSARTPARTSARAPRPDLHDDEDNIDYEDEDDDGGGGGGDDLMRTMNPWAWVPAEVPWPSCTGSH